MRHLRMISSFFLASIFFLSPASAATQMFEAFLDGLQEVAPNASPAFGSAQLTLDDVTGNWTLTGSFQDLLGSANNAHIHGAAPAGVNAGVIAGLLFDPGFSGALSGGGTFTAGQMADLSASLYYVNLHSTVFPGGEIRGQLFAVPEPSSVMLVGLCIVGAETLRRRKKLSKN